MITELAVLVGAVMAALTVVVLTIVIVRGRSHGGGDAEAPQLNRVIDLNNHARHEPLDPIDEAASNADLAEMSLAGGPPAN